MKTKILNAPDISCDHCERAIKKALDSLPGVRRVEVDIPKREVHLEFDEGLVNQAAIETILAKEGYPVAPETATAPVKRVGSSCCGSRNG